MTASTAIALFPNRTEWISGKERVIAEWPLNESGNAGFYRVG
jgi:hypothetical protein